jgi:hypothetical protein
MERVRFLVAIQSLRLEQSKILTPYFSLFNQELFIKDYILLKRGVEIFAFSQSVSITRQTLARQCESKTLLIVRNTKYRKRKIGLSESQK